MTQEASIQDGLYQKDINSLLTEAARSNVRAEVDGGSGILKLVTQKTLKSRKRVP